MTSTPTRIRLLAIAATCSVLALGCSSRLETGYGSMKGTSINGTSVLADMFRERGDEVRTAYRLTDRVDEWADVIVRFSPHDGLPDREEADWYLSWLEGSEDRRLVYVVRDFDSTREYWDTVLRELGPETSDDDRKRIDSSRDAAKQWAESPPLKVSDPAEADQWFHFGRPIEPPRVCGTLDGPWADGISAEDAAIAVHQPFDPGTRNILLSSEAVVLAMDWDVEGEGRVLALTNGSFLLNATLVNPERRKLADRVMDWTATDGRSRHVAFVEGRNLLSEPAGNPTIWDLFLRVTSFRWVAIQMGILGLVACLARAPRLGRPRPEATGHLDRPSAHAEALGELLARTRSSELSERALDEYRSWRRGRWEQDG